MNQEGISMTEHIDHGDLTGDAWRDPVQAEYAAHAAKVAGTRETTVGHLQWPEDMGATVKTKWWTLVDVRAIEFWESGPDDWDGGDCFPYVTIHGPKLFLSAEADTPCTVTREVCCGHPVISHSTVGCVSCRFSPKHCRRVCENDLNQAAQSAIDAAVKAERERVVSEILEHCIEPELRWQNEQGSEETLVRVRVIGGTIRALFSEATS